MQIGAHTPDLFEWLWRRIRWRAAPQYGIFEPLVLLACSENLTGWAAVQDRVPSGSLVMILGMSTSAFTLLHVVISLVAIFSGGVVLLGWLRQQSHAGWTAFFLVTTVLTSVTGFFFHSTSFGPPHIVGVLSLLILAVAIPALYVFHLAGFWRWVYIVGASAALYLNVFVGVVQAFQKLSFLKPLAPTQSEPPFLIAQVAVMLIFIVLGFLAVRRFHPAATAAA
jgi:hypothetical protein